MTRLFFVLLTLLFSLSGPALGKYGDFDRSSLAPGSGLSVGLEGGGETALRSLSSRQKGILDVLSSPTSEAFFAKKGVSMADLRNLTLHTRDEFAMFTRRGERLIMRGAEDEIPYSLLSHSRAAELSSQGWRLSGHTHTPGFLPVGSPGDISILRAMGQRQSAVWGTGTDLRPGIFYSSGSSGADAINALLGIP